MSRYHVPGSKANYSKRVRCSQCGDAFPKNLTVVFSAGTAVLRLCAVCHEPKRKMEEARVAENARKAREQADLAKENIAKRGESNERRS